MATIVSSNSATQRIPGGEPVYAMVPITIAGNGVSYTQGGGNGLPFDIGPLLNSLVQPPGVTVNPNDIVGLIAADASNNQVLLSSLTVGTAVYNTTPDITGLAGTPGGKNTTLSSLPCTARIFGGTSELASGAYNGTLTGWLLVARGGKN